MSSVQRLSLDGAWLFQGFPGRSLRAGETSQDESRDAEIAGHGFRVSAWREAVVPGVVHLDLMRNDLLSDPFLGMNEKEAAWVEKNGWWYRKEFDLAPELLEENEFLLRFEGLDTFASVYLNGKKLAVADNMFIPWEFPVKEFLRVGRNVLAIKFSSPTTVLEGLEQEGGKLAAVFYSARLYGRKAQYSFGWDWAPRLPASGIWRPVSLVAYRDLLVRALAVEPVLTGDGGATFRVAAKVDSRFQGEVTLLVTIRCDGEESSFSSSAHVEPGANTLGMECQIASVRLWWPAGYGEQPLYLVKAAISRADEVLDEAEKTTAVRKVELVQEDDVEGKSFIFKVNGVQVFFKGANWVPADCFLPRVTPEKYASLLDMVVSGNMNMLRVWGGGVYEADEFYSLCDQKGIAVWQDFMFACGEYPEEEWFYQKVKAEAEAIVKRLRHHPCIVLWCGNNENDWGFYEKLWGMRKEQYLGATIYHRILPEVCATLDTQRPYWPSSPFGGDNPNSENQGDRHSWDTCSAKLEDKPGQRWDNGRFISEFGFQAPPVLRTIQDFAGAEDDFLSPVMRHHNRAGEEAMGNILRLTSHYLPQASGLEKTVVSTQACQGELLREAIEHWRRRKFKTSGVLVWQLNDCWPATSWSLIDYWHNPKAAYYAVRRAFAPVLLSLVHQEHHIHIWLVNDTPKPVTGTIRLALLDFDGTPLHSKDVAASVSANSSTVVGVKSLQELGFLDSTRHFIYARLGERTRTVAESIFLLSRVREIRFPRPNVMREVRKAGARIFEVELRSKTFAKAVSIETKAALEYSDNYVDLIPSVRKSILVTVKRDMEPEEFEAGLRVSNGILV